MNSRDFIEQNLALIEDEKFVDLFKLADDKLFIDDYNELAQTLVDADILKSTDKLAEHKLRFDLDELEELIEESVDYECRVKYMEIEQSIVDNTLHFVYCSQEAMYQEAVNIIIPCLNNYLSDTSKALVGAHVDGVAYCRDTPRKTIPVVFDVVDHMDEFELEYQYSVVFSEAIGMYAEVYDTLQTFEDYADAYDYAEDLVRNHTDEILEEYDEGHILLLKTPDGLDINNISGDTLMQYVEEDWGIWE